MSYKPGMRMIKKITNTARADSDTLVDDPHLLVGLRSGHVYRFRFTLFYDTVPDADFKCIVAYSTTKGVYREIQRSILPSTTAIVVDTNVGFTQLTLTGSGTFGGWVEIDGIISPTGSGAFSIQWAQNTSDASNTTVYAGSSLELEEMT